MEPDKFHCRSADQEPNRIQVGQQSKDVIDQNIVDVSASSTGLTDFFHFDTNEHHKSDLWAPQESDKYLHPYANNSGLPWAWDDDGSQSMPYGPENFSSIDDKKCDRLQTSIPHTDATHSPISNITYDIRSHSPIADNLPVEIQDSHNSVAAASENKPVAEASSATMGSILFNGKFKCTKVACANKTFGRRAELQRHHATIHAVEQWFWCPVPSCSRSKEPFSRKDKFGQHMRKMHKD